MVAPQRVGPDQDDALRRLAAASPAARRRRGCARRAAPEAERARAVLRVSERASVTSLARERAPGPPATVLPAMRPRDACARARGRLRRPSRRTETRKVTGSSSTVPSARSSRGARGQADVEAHRLGRARDERLAVDLREPLPAEAGRHRGQVLAARHEADRLDLERRARLVRRPEEDVPRARRQAREVWSQRVGAHLVAGHDGAREGPRGSCARSPSTMSRSSFSAPARDSDDVGARGHPHADLDLVERVGRRRARTCARSAGSAARRWCGRRAGRRGWPGRRRRGTPPSRGSATASPGAAGAAPVEAPLGRRRRLRLGDAALDGFGLVHVDQPDRVADGLFHAPAGEGRCDRRHGGQGHASPHATSSLEG